MHQLSISCKLQRLLASFEVLEISEKAGGTDILRDGQIVNNKALNFLANLKMAIFSVERQLSEKQ